jgi:hypothetical protein
MGCSHQRNLCAAWLLLLLLLLLVLLVLLLGVMSSV